MKSVRTGNWVRCLCLLTGLAHLGCSDGPEPIIESKPSEALALTDTPVPISGGTLALSNGEGFAVAADSDSDRVLLVDLKSGTRAAEFVLEEGDEPGRVVAGKGSQVHIALRRGGAVVTIDVLSHEQWRRPACPAPRGMAYDVVQDQLYVACAGGELVTLSSDLGAAPTRVLRLERDLRDVMLSGNSLLVSRFRSAELLTVNAQGHVSKRHRPNDFHSFFEERTFTPTVAWRTRMVEGLGVVMVHQRATSSPVGLPSQGHDDLGEPAESSYGGSIESCEGPIVHTAVSVIQPDAPSSGTSGGDAPPLGIGGLHGMVLPVDVAISPNGERMMVVAAGSGVVREVSTHQLLTTDEISDCNLLPFGQLPVQGQPVAVEYLSDGRVLVQTRQSANIQLFHGLQEQMVWSAGFSERPEESGVTASRHVGHDLFHQQASPSSAIACASCHAEGRDDGHVWDFSAIGRRRTQSVAGGILATAPLHWDGDMNGIDTIMDEVFVRRMGGAEAHPERVEGLAQWIDAIPSLPPSESVDEEAVVRGEQLFHDATVACASCHSGPMLTNNDSMNVGTGKAFQVPSLRGIVDRAPYMHDGCAATLRDRFGVSCGGGDAHGKTSHLTNSQLDDLVAYLETL